MSDDPRISWEREAHVCELLVGSGAVHYGSMLIADVRLAFKIARARPDREQVEAALEAYTDCVEALDAFDPEPLIIRKQQRIEEARAALLALIFPEPS